MWESGDVRDTSAAAMAQVERCQVQSKAWSVILALASSSLIAGCASGALFGFPADQGDIVAGRQAFIDHRCHQCHSIADERLPPLAGADRPILQLGGPTTMVRSYADLTTSIINPNHAISERYRDQQLLLNSELPLESPMPMPNIDTMSVRQLIDIVAFLDSRYQLIVEDYE
jgi:sulfur-oxidizing protein SoxX